ncbi:MAG: DNA topoisomerase I [Thermoplasmatota archaeon]
MLISQINGIEMKLVICEKNIAANRIAYILSNGKIKSQRIGKTPVYEFVKDNEQWKVIGLRGHIINLDYPKKYNGWQAVSPIELINIDPCKNVSEKSISLALKDLVATNPSLIIATDYDREGELIGVEAIELIHDFNKKIDKIKRAKFSAITGYEIHNAFQKLSEVDYNLSNAGQARQIIDLVWGVVLTRFISLTANRLGKDFLSIGRVQSPTLAILVQREKEIQQFEPKTYWKIIARLKKDELFDAVHSKDQIWDKQDAQQLYDKVKDAKKALIKEVTKKIEKEYPPPPFNTTTFLQAVSYLGLSATKAMSIAEELYMAGLVSYPRTDNTVYPSSLNIKGIVEKLKNSAFSKEASEVLSNGRPRPTRGKKQTTDHPPIHPVDAPMNKKLSLEQEKVYELICRRFLATLAKDAVSESVHAILSISGEDFKTTGYRLVEPHWKNIYTYIKEKRKTLPSLSEGEIISVTKIILKEDQTKPPQRYTQGSLIAKMEQLSLGTKSTRHEIINKLYQRKYITGSNLVPTSIAIAVIDALSECDVVKPKMTAVLENDMNDISEGKKSLEKTISESRKMLSKVMIELENEKDQIKKSITTAHLKQNRIGVCPLCGKDMLIRNSRSGNNFVGCSNFPDCRNTYPLPQKVKIIPTTKKCDTCDAPLIEISSKNKKKKEICINPKCSKVSNEPSFSIGPCPKCGKDMIIRTSRSGDHFVGCTNFPRCKNTYSLPKNKEINPTRQICNQCKAPLISIDVNNKKPSVQCLNAECPSRKQKKYEEK